jgi:glyoxylase-like metal-dependent hydrolase (beta-lactamase superfamily II)
MRKGEIITMRAPRKAVFAVTVLTALAPGGLPARAGAAAPTVEEVAPGTFAVLQPTARRFNESNSLFAIGEEGVLVVDTQSTLEATGVTIREIRARTELPVTHLVLTHWHGDHVQGISAYREAWPEVEVIGHATVAEDIRGRAEPQADEEIGRYDAAIAAARERLRNKVDREGEPLSEEAQQTLAGQIAEAEATVAGKRAVPRPFAVPERTYDDELVLGAGPAAVRVRHVKAHTRGDSVVWLPEARVLVTGDVLDDLPFGGHGYPASWVAALEEIAGMEPKVIVPGHGSVRRGREHLGLVLDMFRSLVAQTAAAAERGLDLEATQAAVDLDTYRRRLAGDDPIAGRAWDNFIPPTIERAWLEARGELPD